jgi:hypothetical protein
VPHSNEDAAYNERVKAVVKSAALGVLAMALFFCFFVLIAIPVAMLVGHAPAVPDVFLPVPPWLFRRVGLPLSAGAFVAGFVMGMRKFRSNL